MNHGRCKNCWWWKLVSVTLNAPLSTNPLVNLAFLAKQKNRGICYMQSINVDIPGAEIFHETPEDSYCPDYINRKRVKEKPIWQQ